MTMRRPKRRNPSPFPPLPYLPPVGRFEFDANGLPDAIGILRLYSVGWFPMTSGEPGEPADWVSPELRAVLPLGGLRVTRSLARTVRSGRYEIRIDSDFNGAIRGCAERESTWLSPPIIEAFRELHRLGFAHSVEAWDDGRMVGGLYGLALGQAFFGESMFSRARDASKVALVHLVARLRCGGFRILDAQIPSAHLSSLGAIEVGRGEFRAALYQAVQVESSFLAMPEDLPPQRVLQLSTHTS